MRSKTQLLCVPNKACYITFFFALITFVVKKDLPIKADTACMLIVLDQAWQTPKSLLGISIVNARIIPRDWKRAFDEAN